MMPASSQFPLGLDPLNANSLSDFLVSNSNEHAYTLITEWPNWTPHAACIFGPEGCGKSHLASALASQSSHKFVKPDEPMESLHPYKHFILEDYDSTSYQEETVFHLYNWAKEQGGTILFTARNAPSTWPVSLADLKSRFGLMQQHEISDPDDMLLEMIYYKLFSDRQIQVDPTVIKYLTVHGERRFSAALSYVHLLDREALSRQCKVSRKLAVELLQNI